MPEFKKPGETQSQYEARCERIRAGWVRFWEEQKAAKEELERNLKLGHDEFDEAIRCWDEGRCYVTPDGLVTVWPDEVGHEAPEISFDTDIENSPEGESGDEGEF
jgi:hypothetical protein